MFLLHDLYHLPHDHQKSGSGQGRDPVFLHSQSAPPPFPLPLSSRSSHHISPPFRVSAIRPNTPAKDLDNSQRPHSRILGVGRLVLHPYRPERRDDVDLDRERDSRYSDRPVRLPFSSPLFSLFWLSLIEPPLFIDRQGRNPRLPNPTDPPLPPPLQPDDLPLSRSSVRDLPPLHPPPRFTQTGAIEEYRIMGSDRFMALYVGPLPGYHLSLRSLPLKLTRPAPPRPPPGLAVSFSSTERRTTKRRTDRASTIYTLLMLFIVRFRLGERTPCLWFALAWVVFGSSQVVLFLTHAGLCKVRFGRGWGGGDEVVER